MATLLPGIERRRLGDDPAFRESAVGDGLLNLLDRHRRLIDAQHTRRFARRRTDAAGELRKIVGRVQPPHRLFPTVLIHQLVPVGNDVVHRATGMAERHAAVHAARTLLAQLFVGQIAINLEPVVHPLGDRSPLRQFAIELQKSSRPSHDAPAPLRPRWRPAHSAVCRPAPDRWRSPALSPAPRAAHASTRAERPSRISARFLSTWLRIQAARGLPVSDRCFSIIAPQFRDIVSIVSHRLQIDRSGVALRSRETRRSHRAHRPGRRSCRRRSCVRRRRARPPAHWSCTRSHGRQRPQPPPMPRSCEPQNVPRQRH